MTTQIEILVLIRKIKISCTDSKCKLLFLAFLDLEFYLLPSRQAFIILDFISQERKQLRAESILRKGFDEK